MLRPTIVYAAGCPFCCRIARLVAWLDRGDAVAFLKLDDERVDALIPDLTFAERVEKWHLVTTFGEDLTDGAAVVALLQAIGTTRWLGRVLAALHVERFLTWLMSVISARRGRLGRWVGDCDPPLRYP